MLAAKKDEQILKSYDFNKVNKIAERAAIEIMSFLNKLPVTVMVENVEKNKSYQEKDIDMIWHYNSRKTGKVEQKTIEIKGDRYYHTGNYFFETISNSEKGTPGCFMYTEADWIFYYFVDEKELHILPTQETRKWFIENESRFREAKTTTTSSRGLLYATKGRKVPRGAVSDNIKVEKFDLTGYI